MQALIPAEVHVYPCLQTFLITLKHLFEASVTVASSQATENRWINASCINTSLLHDKQTTRKPYRQVESHTDRQTERHTDKKPARQTESQAYRKPDRQTESQTESQTDKQTQSQTDSIILYSVRFEKRKQQLC